MRVVFVGRHRPIWPRLVLYIVTLGISRRVWLYRINKEIDGHAALGLNHRLNFLLLVLPVIGPFIVQCQTTKRLNEDLHTDLPLAYGRTWALCLLGLVPPLGNLVYIGWTQDRLNRYWAHERGNRRHGIDVDVGLDKDPKFIAELAKAQDASRMAGSRFDVRRDRRRERYRRARATVQDVAKERAIIRQVGGSTPVLPWLRPTRPTPRELHITCGRCDQAFHVRQDPLAETPIVCPQCGLNEVLPSVGGNPLGEPDVGIVPVLEVDCPKCRTHFHAVRNLEGKTRVQCYQCGKAEIVAA